MTALSQRLFHAGADLLTFRTARRLRRPSGAVAHQKQTWRGLVRQFAKTKYGHDSGLDRKINYERFRTRVPMQAYEHAQPWIERMKRGEADVLWPGTCNYYAVSSGTATGRTRHLPVTSAMIAHFRRAGALSSLFYTSRTGHARVFRGRHLILGGSTSLDPIQESRPFMALAGDMSGIVAKQLPGWVEKHLYEPGRDIARITNWSEKIDAIVERTWNRDITLIAGIPNWVLELAAQLLSRIDTGAGDLRNLQALWPNLECLVHGGVPIGPFTEPLRAALGPTVNFHEVYPA